MWPFARPRPGTVSRGRAPLLDCTRGGTEMWPFARPRPGTARSMAAEAAKSVGKLAGVRRTGKIFKEKRRREHAML